MEQEPEQFDLEAEYLELSKKHNLPNFQQLCEDFDIEKISEKETSFLAREIRRTINEKISAYIHLFETLINPQSPPLFVFTILKNMSEKEKQQIQEFYKVLSKTQLQIMKLDTVYSEQKEIEFINASFKTWQEMKTKINKLFESFETNFENGDTSNKRSYFD